MFLKENKDTIKNIPEIYKATKETSSTFPNIEVLLKYFRIIPVSNASEEKSFSILKRVKNYLRSTAGEETLREKKHCGRRNTTGEDMAILYIQEDIFNQINKDKVIDEFEKIEARRKFIKKNYFTYFPASLVEHFSSSFPQQVKRE